MKNAVTKEVNNVVTTVSGVASMDKDFTRTKALIECWADWRGTVRQVLLQHMQPKCTLGPWTKSVRQRGELWRHNESHNETPQSGAADDDLMCLVDRVICDMSAAHRDVLWVTHVNGRYWPVLKRCRSLDVTRSTYYRHLESAYRLVDRAIEHNVGWRNVVGY